MKLRLKPQPDSVCEAVTAIEAEVLRPRPGALELRYRVSGNLARLVLPARAPALRTDGLWRRTCLEAFLRAPGGEAYYELNLSPSTEWAAYGFTGYRSGMAPALTEVPAIALRTDAEGFQLQASLEVGSLPGLPPDGPWRLGLSAVIQEAGGRISYWALAHAPGKPDFHHAAGFAAELGPT